MTAITTTNAGRRDWRAVALRVVLGLIAVPLLLTDGIDVVVPWIDLTSYRAPEYHAGLHRWHDAQWGALTGILFVGSLLALLWKPRAQPLLLHFLALSSVIITAIGARFDPLLAIIFLALAALIGAAYPDRRALLRFARAGQVSVPLLALGGLTAALLAPDAWRSLQLQLAGADVHAHYGHWGGAAMLDVVLALAGLLAATKRPGWQVLGVLAGATLIYLGLVAVMLPSQAGSWGSFGGALATLGGWAFVGATLWEAHRANRRDPGSISRVDLALY